MARRPPRPARTPRWQASPDAVANRAIQAGAWARIPDVDCDRFAEVAAELALGVLTGRERGEAVPQLDRCDACREAVRELAFTGEELLGLLPEVTPPAGLEFRVLDELGGYGPRRHRRRRGRRGSARPQLVVAAAAAAVLAVGGGLAGWMASGATSGAGALHPATLTTARHQALGRGFP